jgi:hypothetical protein
MPEIQEIDVFVNPDGTVKLEVRGVKGQKCRELTRKLEELLGNQVIDRVPTAEFDEVEQEPNVQEETPQVEDKGA